MAKRNNRRRARSIHDGRAHNDRVTIDALAPRNNGAIDGIDRLILLCATASGDASLSLSELRTEVCKKVIEAGSVGEAIKRQIVLR